MLRSLNRRCWMRVAGQAMASLAGVSAARAADSSLVLPPGEAATPPGARKTLAQTGILRGETPRNPRVLFITAKGSVHSKEELARLSAPDGDFQKMRGVGWTIGETADNLIQIVDRQQVPEIIERLAVGEFPTVACIDKDEIVRYFRFGCTTPLDMWTFGFLAKGIDERPPGFVMETARVESTGHYPLRGNHWSVDGDWSPLKEKVVSHLHSSNHQSSLLASWRIEEWSLEELRSMHDDLHEREERMYGSSGSSKGRSSGQSAWKF